MSVSMAHHCPLRIFSNSITTKQRIRMLVCPRRKKVRSTSGSSYNYTRLASLPPFDEHLEHQWPVLARNVRKSSCPESYIYFSITGNTHIKSYVEIMVQAQSTQSIRWLERALRVLWLLQYLVCIGFLGAPINFLKCPLTYEEGT